MGFFGVDGWRKASVQDLKLYDKNTHFVLQNKKYFMADLHGSMADDKLSCLNVQVPPPPPWLYVFPVGKNTIYKVAGIRRIQ